MEVSFGAKYIDSANVTKFVNKVPANINAAIVELENYGDWYAIELFAEKVSQGNTKNNYATQVRDSFVKVLDGDIVDADLHHYILTSQESDFENLDPEKVLGAFWVADKRKLSPQRLRSLNIKGDYVTKVRYLQGSPDSYYGDPDRKHAGIGKAMLDFIKEKFNQYVIVAKVDTKEIPFYLSQGLELSKNPNAQDMMIYRHNKHGKPFRANA